MARVLLRLVPLALVVAFGCKSKGEKSPLQRPEDTKTGAEDKGTSSVGGASGGGGSPGDTRGSDFAVSVPDAGVPAGVGAGNGHGNDDRAGRPRKHGNRVDDTVGQVVAVGSLDQAIIRRQIKKRLVEVNKCYDAATSSKPQLEGAIVTRFTIKPDGKVVEAKSSGIDDELGRCVAKVIEQIEFPRPKNGDKVTVSYPFQFRAQPSDAGSGSGR